MYYLPFAILGYFLNSVANLTDKALLDRDIPSPMLYTFYLGLLSFVSLMLIPFGFKMPDPEAIIFALLSGLSLIGGWLFFYQALQHDEASRVSPVVGTITPIFTLMIGYLFLAQNLNSSQLIAFIILVTGMAILSSPAWLKSSKEREHLLFILVSSLFFALSSVFLRQSFVESDFISTLVTTKVFIGVSVLTFLLWPSFRTRLVKGRIEKHKFINSTSKLFLAGQLAGGLGGLFLAYSISLVSPAVINSLQGVQYVFLLLAVFLVPGSVKHLLQERFSQGALWHKVGGSIIIAAGLIILALGF